MSPPPCKNCKGTQWLLIGVEPGAPETISPKPSVNNESTISSTKKQTVGVDYKGEKRKIRPTISSTFMERVVEEESYDEKKQEEPQNRKQQYQEGLDPWGDVFLKKSRSSLRKTLRSMMVTPDIPPITDMLIYETKRWIYIFGCSDVSVLLGGGTGISNQVRGSNKNSGSSNIKEGDRVGESNETRGSKGSNGETQLETCYNFIKISRRDDLNDRKKHTLNDIITIDPHTYTRSDARNLLSTLSAIAAS
jgi:hypothetical protein